MKICPECLERVEDEYDYCPDDGTELREIHARTEDPMEGRVFDEKWMLQSRIGSGGMGTVYRANQLNIDRTVAVKVLRAALVEDDEHVERFFREANVASNINDPRCVTIFDFGQTPEDQVLYLAMEYLEGESLQERFKREPLTFRESIAVGIQICEALEKLHENGVVHRDLKPENVILVGDIGEDIFLKLLDFGLAKVSSSDATPVTATGKVFGTPAFMSPEQCMGSEIGLKSDLYALGCLLYQLVAGDTPFSGGASVQILLSHVNKEPPPIEHHATVPSDFAALMGELLEKNPADRPASAEEVRRRLEQIETRVTTGTGMAAPKVVEPKPGELTAEERKQMGVVETQSYETTDPGQGEGVAAPVQETRPFGEVDEPEDGSLRDDLQEADPAEAPDEDDEANEEVPDESPERAAGEGPVDANEPAESAPVDDRPIPVMWLVALGIVFVGVGWILARSGVGGEGAVASEDSRDVTVAEDDGGEHRAATGPLGDSGGEKETSAADRTDASAVADDASGEDASGSRGVAGANEVDESGGRAADNAGGSDDESAGAATATSGAGDGEAAKGGGESGAGAEEALLPVLTKSAVNQIFKSKNPVVRKCFEKGLTTEGFDGGSVRLKLVVGGDGSVRSASAIKSTVGVSGIVTCIESAATSWDFPPTSSGSPAVLEHEYAYQFESID